MKQNWTRLASMVLKLGGNTTFMSPRFSNLFLRHHKNACEIVTDRKGVPLAAVYFTPEGKNPDFIRGLMKAIQERTKL